MFLEVATITGDAINIINASGGLVEISSGVASLLDKLGIWIKAIGIIAILAVIFQLVSIYMNSRKAKHLKELNEKIAKLEEKIDVLLKKI